MADEGSTKLGTWGAQREQQPGTEAPLGLRQWAAAGGVNVEPNQGAQQWFSGRNTEGTDSGWNTPFYDKWEKQTDKAVKEGWIDQYFQKGGTGIVTYDHEQQTDGEYRYAFGDIYEDGEYKGNVYETYKDDPGTADLMMLQLTNDPQTQAKAFNSRNPDQIRLEVERRREEGRTRWEEFQSRKEFDDKREQVQQSYGEDDDRNTVLAAAGGGALVGAGIGATLTAWLGPGALIGGGIGAAIGGVVGGFGGWLNRDSLQTQAARAQVQTDMAREQFGDAEGNFAWLQGQSGLAMQMAMPTTNLLQGGYDAASEGGVGDDVASWFALDEEGKRLRPGILQVAEVGTGIIDAAGLFGTGIGAAAYQGMMAGHVVGSTGLLLSSNFNMFDHQTGQYSSIAYNEDGSFNPGTLASGIGVIGIDLVQMGMAHGMYSTAKSAMKTSRTELSTGAAVSSRKVVQGGMVYTLDAGGKAVSRRVSTSILAPSEMFQNVSARYMAAREIAKAPGKGTLQVDDIYRQSVALSRGDKTWTSMLVNGFGEGTEEVAQVVLETIALGHDLNMDVAHDAFEAGTKGFAMGMGMTLGTKGRVSGDTRMMSQAYTKYKALGGTMNDEEFKKSWKEMSAAQRQEAGHIPKGLQMELEGAAQIAQKEQDKGFVLGVPAINRVMSAIEARALAWRAKGTEHTDSAWALGVFEDATTPGHAAVLSLKTLLDAAFSKLEGLKIQLASNETTEEDKAWITGVLEHSEQITEFLNARAQQYLDAGGNEPLQRAIIDGGLDASGNHIEGINQFILKAWTRSRRQSVVDDQGRPTRLSEDQRTQRAQAITQLIIRDPMDDPGSFQALMPIVSIGMTERGENHAIQVSPAILKAINGDTDGDKGRQQNQVILGKQAFINLRKGKQFLGSVGKDANEVNIPPRTFDKALSYEIADALKSPDSARRKVAQDLIIDVQRKLNRRYKKEISPQELTRLGDLYADALRSSNDKARNIVLNEVARRHANALAKMDREDMANEFLWIDQEIQRSMQKFQTALSEMTLLDESQIDREAPDKTPLAANVRKTRTARAVSDGLTMMHELGGQKVFRSFQGLFFTSKRSVVEQLNQGDNTVIDQLTDSFLALNSGIDRPLLESLGMRDEITARVSIQLQKLAANWREGLKEAFPDEPIPTNPQLLTTLSLMKVTNVDSTGQVYEGPITMTQWLLRESVFLDMADKKAVLANDESLQRKHNTLLSLTRNNERNPEGKELKNWSYANLEVLGSMTMVELLGEEASAAFGSNLTLDQVIKQYADLNEDSRKQEKERYLQLPEMMGKDENIQAPYTQNQIGRDKISPTRAVVSMILDVGNNNITAKDDGKPIGRFADASNRTQLSLERGIASFQAALTETLGPNSLDPRSSQSAEDIVQLLNDDADFSTGLLGLLQDDAVLAGKVLRPYTMPDGTQGFTIEPWVIDMLRSSPKEGAMIFLRNTILLERDALMQQKQDEDGEAGIEIHKLKNRWQQLISLLAQNDDTGVLVASFERDLMRANDIDAFVALVNTVYRGNMAPFTAFHSDVADYTPDLFKGGWGSSGGNTNIRDSVTEFENASQRLRTRMSNQHQNAVEDTNTINAILAGYEGARQDSANTDHQQMMRRWEGLIDLSKQQAGALSPLDVSQMLYGVMTMFMDSVMDKGKVSREFSPAGALGRKSELPGTRDAHTRHLEQLTAPILSEVGANPTSALFTAGESVDRDGTLVTWDQLDAEELARAFASNPKARPLILQLVLPGVWESTPNGGLVKKFTIATTLHEAMEEAGRGTVSRLYEKSHSSKQLFNSTIDAMAAREDPANGNFFTARLSAHLTAAWMESMKHSYTAKDLRDREAWATDAVAEVVRMAGQLAGQTEVDPATGELISSLQALRNEMELNLRKTRLARILGHDPSEMGFVESLFTAMDIDLGERGEAEAVALVERNNQLMKEGRFDELVDASAAIEYTDSLRGKIHRMMNSNEFIDIFDKYTLDPSSAVASLATKTRIFEAVLAAPALASYTPNVSELINRVQSRVKSDNFTQLPDLLPADWQKLGEALIVFEIQNLTTMPVSGIHAPVLDLKNERARDLFDPTFFYLVKDVLDVENAAVKSSAKLNFLTGNQDTVKKDDLRKLIERVFFHKDRIGAWTTDVYQTTVFAQEMFDTRAVEVGITQAGIAPMAEITETAATALTRATPPQGSESNAMFTYSQLMSSNKERINTEVTVLNPEDLTPLSKVNRTTPLANLNGRFASGALLSYIDENGDPQTKDLWAVEWSDPENMSSFRPDIPALGRYYTSIPEVADSGYRVVTVANLKEVVKDALQVLLPNTDLSQEAASPLLNQIDLQLTYLDPTSVPVTPEYANNIYFTGVSFEVDANMQPSINAEGWFSEGGESPKQQAFPLGASKNGIDANPVNKPATPEERAAMEADWRTDFAGMIEAKALDLLNRDPGTGQLADHFYNFVYNEVLRKQAVVGTDKESGERRMLSSKQVIEWQMREQQSIDELLDGATLISIPADVLRSMLGEMGTQGASYIEDITTMRNNRVDSFNWIFTDEMIAKFPHLLDTVEGTNDPKKISLWDSSLTRMRSPEILYRPRQPMSPQEESRLSHYIDMRNARFSRGNDQRQDNKPYQKGREERNAAIQAEFSEALKFDSVRLPLGLVGITGIQVREESNADMAKMVFNDHARAMDKAVNQSIWALEAVSERNHMDGVITSANIPGNEGKTIKLPKGFEAIPGDIVVVNLASYRKKWPTADNAFIQKRINHDVDYMRSLGVTLTLSSDNGGTDFLHDTGWNMDEAHVAGDNGYRRANGSSYMWVPAWNEQLSANQRSRQAHVWSTQSFDPADVMIVIQSDDVDFDENTIGITPALRNLYQARVVDLVPTSAYATFNVPITKEEIDVTRAHLNGFNNDAGRSFLLKQAGIKELDDKGALTKEAASMLGRLDDMFARWKSSSQVVPVRGQEFGTGDFLPLIDPHTHQVILSRYGHIPLQWHEYSEQFKKGVLEGESSNIAVAGPKLVGADATVHRGFVKEWSPASRVGRQITLNVPVQTGMAKWLFEQSGYKGTSVELDPKRFRLPQHDITESTGVHAVMDRTSAGSKENNVMLGNTFGVLMAGFGFNFEVDLINFFFGVDIHSKKFEAAYPDADKRAKQESFYRTTVNNILREVQQLEKVHPTEIQSMLSGNFPITTVLDQLSDITVADAATTIRKNWVAAMQANEPSGEAQVAFAVMAYLMAPGTRIEDILKTGGLNSPNARQGVGRSVQFPSAFTDFFDNALFSTDPNAKTLRTYLVGRLNRQLNNANAVNGEGYAFNEQLQLVIKAWNPETRKHEVRSGRVQFVKMTLASENPTLAQQVDDRRIGTTQQASAHASAMAYLATGSETAYSRRTDRITGSVLARDEKELAKLTSSDGLLQFLRRVPVDGGNYVMWNRDTAADQLHRLQSRSSMRGYRVALRLDQWKKRFEDEGGKQLGQYVTERARIAQRLGLKKSQEEIVDYWVRQHQGRPGSKDPKNKVGDISPGDAMQALTAISQNIDRGVIPTAGARVPLLHELDLDMLYRANKGGRAPGSWQLLADFEGDPVYKWDDWVNTSLGTFTADRNTGIDPAYKYALDGFYHTYLNAGRAWAGLAVSTDSLIAAKLADPKTSEVLMSLDKFENVKLKQPVLLSTSISNLSTLIGLPDPTAMPVATTEQVGLQTQANKRMAKWRKKKGVSGARTSGRGLLEAGKRYVDDSKRTNTFVRLATNVRVGNAMWNPALWVSSIGEFAIQTTLENMTSLLMGTSVGTGLGKAASNITEKTGVKLSSISPETQKQLGMLIEALSNDPVFNAMAYRETAYQLKVGLHAGVVERLTSTYARVGTMMTDAQYGMTPKAMARRYVEAALDYISARPGETAITPEAFVAYMKDNSLWAEQHMGDLHSMGIARMARVRSLREHPLQIMLQGVISPLSSSTIPMVNVTSNLFLTLPLMFSNFAFNISTTMLGLHGPMAMLAQSLDSRKMPWLKKFQAALAHKQYDPELGDYTDFSKAIDSINLSRAFVQSGMTHTGLFMLASMAGGWGMTGGSEEERKRRLMARAQGVELYYDPRQLENDFRNADAIYLDNLPLGLGQLFGFFDVSETDSTSMAHMNWVVRQFVSPIMGITRYLDTGDTRHIMWGYQDALGAFPLINEITYVDAVKTWTQLQDASHNMEMRGTPEDMDAGFALQISFMMTFERMFMENSFINYLYSAKDKYDRDPWVIPNTNETGEILRDDFGLPMRSDELGKFINEDGEIQEGYANRDWRDAQVAALSEKRAGLAIFMSLFTGLSDSPYLRDNMVVKTRQVDKPELTQEETEALVMAIWDPNTQREVLTDRGARAIIDGLFKGSVSIGDPSLEGVYISWETRAAIQDEWVQQILEESIKLGLSEEQAEQRARDLYHGPWYDQRIKGFGDILWDEALSYHDSMKYRQLNTTYVMGPDGRPWATGIERGNLFSAFGLALGIQPLERYYQGDVGNLGVDERLNSTDEVMGYNTGLRALEREDDKLEIPPPPDFETSLTAAKGRTYTPYRRGGGGGGGGYSTRMNTVPRSNIPYASDIPNINVSNPYVRRANIRRERYSSDRGRLKQWQ